MSIVRHDSINWQENRPGSRVRLVIDPAGQVTDLGLVYQQVEPGAGAPSHTHNYDEVITVLDGIAEVWEGDERRQAGPGASVFIPAGVIHGFLNTGQATLFLQAAMNASELHATYIDPAANP